MTGWPGCLTGKAQESAITELNFHRPVLTRYIKIVQTGSEEGFYWSIHDINIEFELE